MSDPVRGDGKGKPCILAIICLGGQHSTGENSQSGPQFKRAIVLGRAFHMLRTFRPKLLLVVDVTLIDLELRDRTSLRKLGFTGKEQRYPLGLGNEQTNHTKTTALTRQVEAAGASADYTPASLRT